MTNPFTQRLEQQAQKQAQQRQAERDFYNQSAAAAFRNPHAEAQMAYQQSQQLQRQLKQTLGGRDVDRSHPQYDTLRNQAAAAQQQSDLLRARARYGENTGGFVQERMDNTALSPQEFQANSMNQFLGQPYLRDMLNLNLPFRDALASTMHKEQQTWGGGITVTPNPAGGSGTPTFSANPFT